MRRTLAERARPTLEYMLRLALQGGGYEWMGLRGWARPDDIRAGTRDPEVRDVLVWITGRTAWLDRADARDPSRTAPLWIYRISEEGAHVLAGEGGHVPCFPVPLPARAERPAGRFFLTRASADALTVLKAEHSHPRAVPYVAGEPGWLPLSAISERTSCFGLGRRVFSDDVARLVRTGLAEQKRARSEPEGPTRVFYRVTDKGARAEPLAWREPQDPNAPPPVSPRLPLQPPGPGR